jgi:hypothetical protein
VIIYTDTSGLLVTIKGDLKMEKPTIVCLCGSTRFKDAFTKAQLGETLARKIVVTIGCSLRDDDDIFGHLSEKELRLVKARLDVLHFAKIDLADEVFILNVDGYIGESTEREICYAEMRGKKITYLE